MVQRLDALEQFFEFRIVRYVHKRSCVRDYPSVLLQVRQIAHSLHRLERDDEVCLAQRDKVGCDRVGTDTQVRLHVSAALAHAVHLGLFDIQPLFDGCGTNDGGDREDSLSSYS